MTCDFLGRSLQALFMPSRGLGFRVSGLRFRVTGFGLECLLASGIGWVRKAWFQNSPGR